MQRRRRALMFILASTTMMWVLFDSAATRPPPSSRSGSADGAASAGGAAADAPQIRDVSSVARSLAAAVNAEGDPDLVYPFNISGLFTGASLRVGRGACAPTPAASTRSSTLRRPRPVGADRRPERLRSAEPRQVRVARCSHAGLADRPPALQRRAGRHEPLLAAQGHVPGAGPVRHREVQGARCCRAPRRAQPALTRARQLYTRRTLVRGIHTVQGVMALVNEAGTQGDLLRVSVRARRGAADARSPWSTLTLSLSLTLTRRGCTSARWAASRCTPTRAARPLA